jgi:hypothetical protein
MINRYKYRCFRLAGDGGIVMAANSKAFVIAGQQAPCRSTSALASGSIQESVLDPGQMRVLRAIMLVGVLLVVAVGVDVAMYLGMV